MPGPGESEIWSSDEDSLNDPEDSASSSDDEHEADAVAVLHEVWQAELRGPNKNDASEPGALRAGGLAPAGAIDGARSPRSGPKTDWARGVAAADPLSRFGSPEDDELQAVPADALTRLSCSLAGPRSSQDWSVRLWTAFGSYHGISGGYLAYRILQNGHGTGLMYTWLQLSVIPVWGFSSVIIGECTLQMGRALLVDDAPLPGGKSEGLLGNGSRATPSARARTNFTYALGLLRSSITEGTAERITRKVLLARVLTWSLIFVIVMCYIGMLRLFFADPTPGNLPLIGVGIFEKVLAIVSIFCCYPTGMLISGWLLFITVPCLVVSDRIRRQARRVRSMREQGQVDWDALVAAIQMAHEDTLRLGAILRPPLQMFRESPLFLSVSPLSPIHFLVPGVSSDRVSLCCLNYRSDQRCADRELVATPRSGPGPA